MPENPTPRPSPQDQELLAHLSPDERDLVLSAVTTYPSLSVAKAIAYGRESGM